MAFNRFKSPHKPPSETSSGIAGLVEAEKLMQIAFVLPAALLIGWLWFLGVLVPMIGLRQAQIPRR